MASTKEPEKSSPDKTEAVEVKAEVKKEEPAKAWKLSNLVPDKHPPIVNPPFEELTMMLYGTQGSGKTSFFGSSKSAFILATEPGAQFQSAFWRPIGRWNKDPNSKVLSFEMMIEGLVEAHNEGKLKKVGIKLVVIDTIDQLYGMACKYLCERERVASIGDIPYGKGYAEALTMVKDKIEFLSSFVSVAFISHAMNTTEELESISGIKKEVEKSKPSVDRRVAEWLAGRQNLVGYAYKSADGQFLLKFHSDHRLETKDRTGFFEAYKKPILNSWDGVVKIYNDAAKAKGVEIRSRWQ